MGKQSTQSTAEQKPGQRRTVDVSAGVGVVMAGLSLTEKKQVEAALRSADAILRLPVDLVVAAESGDMYTAHVTDDLRLIYQIHPDRIAVELLLSAGAVEYLRNTNLRSTSNESPNNAP